MAMKLHGALLSLVLPGLGQFGQHRPIAGHGFLWGTVASLACLMLSERVQIPGTLPLAALGVLVVWSAVDAWRHGGDAADTRA